MKKITLPSGEEQELFTESELQPDKMYVKLKDTAYIYASSNKNLFRMMAGYYLEVETDHLFHDQYNTSRFRIFDNMVERVVNDVRSKWCKSKYSGKMVMVGDEQKYLDEVKSKILTACNGCFWNRKSVVNKSVVEDENKRVTTEEFGDKCTFITTIEAKCTHEEEVKRGFEYFTPKNTFFLKYPNGISKPKSLPYELTKGVKVGTYTLEYIKELDYFRIRNSRKTIDFEYDEKERRFKIIKGMYVKGNHISTLDVPSEANRKVKEILNEAYNG